MISDNKLIFEAYKGLRKYEVFYRGYIHDVPAKSFEQSIKRFSELYLKSEKCELKSKQNLQKSYTIILDGIRISFNRWTVFIRKVKSNDNIYYFIPRYFIVENQEKTRFGIPISEISQLTFLDKNKLFLDDDFVNQFKTREGDSEDVPFEKVKQYIDSFNKYKKAKISNSDIDTIQGI